MFQIMPWDASGRTRSDVLACQVCVNLGRVDAGMAEQFLDVSQGCAAVEQVCRKTVPQRMGSDPGVETCPLAIALQNQPEPCRVSRFPCG